MSTAAPGKISLALGIAKKNPTPTNGIKRAHAALHDNEEEEVDHGKAQRVSHFDRSAGGAIDETRPPVESKPLVIASQANRDWREVSQQSRRQRSGIPQNDMNIRGDGEGGTREREDELKPAVGLNVRKREKDEERESENGSTTISEKDGAQNGASITNGDNAVIKKTEDELAVDALLGRNTQPGLVVPAISEEQAFERDYRTAPEMASLDDYARVPVEQFGAALLRGMGWKEGEGIGNKRGKKIEKTKLPERRPALLGIGAKEEAAVAQELGTWGKAAKDRKVPQQVYNPVLLRDKRTGELFTEEELQKKREREEREKYEMEFEEKERRREKDRRHRDESRERYREHDSREKDRRRHHRDDRDNDRPRSRYDDSDEEYHRRKREKERKLRERARGAGDHGRERSRRYDSDRDRYHDKDRDRRR